MLQLHVLTIFPEILRLALAGKYSQACAGEAFGAD